MEGEIREMVEKKGQAVEEEKKGGTREARRGKEESAESSAKVGCVLCPRLSGVGMGSGSFGLWGMGGMGDGCVCE